MFSTIFYLSTAKLTLLCTDQLKHFVRCTGVDHPMVGVDIGNALAETVLRQQQEYFI